jgi:predicted ABC-type sugar transport system permease subunit
MSTSRAARRLGPFVGLIIIFLGGVLLNGQIFLSLYNQLNVLGRVSIIALPAVGMTLVIITAGIDLSIGSLLSGEELDQSNLPHRADLHPVRYAGGLLSGKSAPVTRRL